MATNPRPAPRRGAMVTLLVVLVIFSAGMFGGGGFLLYEQLTGTPATATVLSCEAHQGRRVTTYECVGQWTIDGRVQTGEVDGVGPDHVDREVAVTVTDGRAYANSSTALITLGGGVLFAALAAFHAWKMRRTTRAAASAPGTAASGTTAVH